MKRIKDNTIIEGNTTIAKYMGRIVVTDAQVCNYEVPNYPNGIVIEFSAYHCNWNELMPVIGKISNSCEEPEELDDLKYALLTNNIDEAYKFVVSYLS